MLTTAYKTYSLWKAQATAKDTVYYILASMSIGPFQAFIIKHDQSDNVAVRFYNNDDPNATPSTFFADFPNAIQAETGINAA